MSFSTHNGRAFLFAIMILFASLFTSGCSSVTPGPGQVAVLIKKPMLFGSGGVDKEAIQTGRAYVAWTTDEVIITVTPETKKEHIEDLPSKEGIPLDFDSQIQYQVVDPVMLVEKFGPDWYNNNLQMQFRMFIKNASKNYTMHDLAFSSEKSDEIDALLEKEMKAFVEAAKLPIRIMNITLGKANPPASIMAQRSETAAQQQRIETEGKRSQAEQARAEAESKRAFADRAYQQGLGITPDQYLRLEQIRALREVCGHANSKCIFGNLPVMMTDK